MHMENILLGTAELKYDTDGDLQIGIFKPMIHVTKDELKNSDIGKCSNKTVAQVQECAQLFLANFFNRISEIELRDIEKTDLKTETVYQEYYDSGSIKAAKFQFIYVDKSKK
jgi:hypothetical protein